MKHSTVLATVMLTALTTGASAANPFSDVPAGHWAYNSITKLAQAGVINGYEDGTFQGDRLMTRYEMAQIVAKAMSKGANVDKLAAEFADELEHMGVRISKLEARQDNVKITGEVRAHFASLQGNSEAWYNVNRTEQIRTRITFNGQINENWSYVGRLENIQDLEDTVGNEQTSFQHAYIDGRLGGMKVKAGRFTLTRDEDGNIYDDRFDGLQVSYGNKYRIGAYYGKPATYDTLTQTGSAAKGEGWTRAYGVNLAAELGKHFNLTTGIDKFYKNENNFDDNTIWDVGLKYNVGKTGLGFTYLKSDSDTAMNTKGYAATLKYGNVNSKKPKSWAINATYYRLGDGINIIHTMNGNSELYTERYKDKTGGGFKGYKIGINYTLAKNMVLGIESYNLKGINNKNFTSKTLWSEIKIYF